MLRRRAALQRRDAGAAHFQYAVFADDVQKRVYLGGNAGQLYNHAAHGQIHHMPAVDAGHLADGAARGLRGFHLNQQQLAKQALALFQAKYRLRLLQLKGLA